MDRETFMRDYWAYYLMLEDKFIDTTNYVTLAEDNYGTYSNEYGWRYGCNIIKNEII